jgi:hypothetical protein
MKSEIRGRKSAGRDPSLRSGWQFTLRKAQGSRQEQTALDLSLRFVPYPLSVIIR